MGQRERRRGRRHAVRVDRCAGDRHREVAVAVVGQRDRQRGQHREHVVRVRARERRRHVVGVHAGLVARAAEHLDEHTASA